MMFSVLGTPVPKGSARAFVVGKEGQKPRAVVVQDNKRPLAHWQTMIANEARQALRQKPETAPRFEGPIELSVVFTFNRPKSTNRAFPSVKPDVDKLLRAVMDALTGVIWKDDAQVVTVFCWKRYQDEAAPEGCLVTVVNA